VVDGIEYIFYLLICLLKLIYKEKKSPWSMSSWKNITDLQK
jgi:hypothetical protein